MKLPTLYDLTSQMISDTRELLEKMAKLVLQALLVPRYVSL